eukprot:TRINITY_DN6620_c0_g2_i1.p1 TRINITY_DN6620_c0_g2~~TRINITY_DN6620_c0_g2_i1.p1  ORF type:complete len:104 (-),score=4.75 TRINITY_DN6620_c0_g2_i1:386-697(-)
MKQRLKSRFEMKDMGEAKYVLGIKITRDQPNRLLTLSRESYLETVLKRFDMMMCKLVDTPINKSENLSSKQGPTTEEDKAMMRDAMLCIRADVAFAFGFVIVQ